MNLQKKFFYTNGQKFTVIVDDNRTSWYLGNDVAIILGYSNPSSASNNCKNAINKTELNDLISDSNIKLDLDFNYRPNTKFIPSIDVTALADKSPNQNKDEIDKFKNWLNNVVNVEIAKDLVPATLEQLVPVSHLISMTTALNNAINRFDTALNEINKLRNENIVLKQDSDTYQKEAEANAEEAKLNKKQAEANAEEAKLNGEKAIKFATVVEEFAPKVEIFNQIAARDDVFTMEEAAKIISNKFSHLPQGNVIGRNTLLKVLRMENNVSIKNIASQRMIESGYFVLKYTEFRGKLHPSSSLVTFKGIGYLIKLCKKYRYLPVVLYPDIEDAYDWAAMLKAAQPQPSTI